MTRHVEIAGAGLAGLTVAAALARRGWVVRVHEAGAELRDFGAGIFLWENGLTVLEELGVAARVLAGAHEARHWREFDSDDNEMGVRPLPLPGGLRMVTMTRQFLYAIMVDAARDAGVEFVLGSRVVGADPDGALIAADGTRLSAELVIAADGIRSAVRASLGLPVTHRVFPFGMFRFLVPRSRVSGAGERWDDYANFWDLIRHRRVLYVPCNERDLYLNLGAADDDMPAIGTPLDAVVWRESFPALAELLVDLPASPRFDRYELVRLPTWSAGRVAVIGDAAHAMPPTLGQGAGTAMTNALSLAIALDQHADVPEALREWEAAERPVTDETQQTSLNVLGSLMPSDGERRDDWTEEPLRSAQRRPRTGTERRHG
ncbi:FAD-dependent oxidoreductase [Micromonospora craniellae]|uniref:FAD-dependent monooxygenase n=1 Tax=Micromonospora craniellae TaxID=2294034 RepID=A0A372FYJ9_9ACTN|nr:NAD(P)/FAD-dependent oxidoreductase [Micromonospora craniellae]RFS45616.1 FAD-dependent monooxygenase [Micromonospora craniellae]